MDIQVRYRDRVADRTSINRAAWAALIASLIASRSDGNQTAFAARVRVSTRTISRWLKAEVDVSPDNVRDVARHLGISPVAMLVRVGYLRDDEMTTTGREWSDPDVQALVDKLSDPATTARQRQWLRQQLRWLAEMPDNEPRSDEQAAS